MPVKAKSQVPTPLSAAEIQLLDNLTRMIPCPVPIPFPNFSTLHSSLAISTKINIDRAQAHGFSPAGANQMYVEGQQPKALPDKMVLARFNSKQAKIVVMPPDTNGLPTQGKMLVSLMTPELAPPPSPILATPSATSASSPLGPPPTAPPSVTSTPNSTSTPLLE